MKQQELTELNILIDGQDSKDVISALKTKFSGVDHSLKSNIEKLSRIAPKSVGVGTTNEVVTILLSGVGGVALNIIASALYDILKTKAKKLWVNQMETSIDVEAIRAGLAGHNDSSNPSPSVDVESRPS